MQILSPGKNICSYKAYNYSEVIFTPHGARHLPIHAVQELAGHSKIETTRKYYLSVGKSDRDLAREIQEKVVTKLTNF